VPKGAAALVRQVSRILKDNPDYVLMTNALAASTTDVTVTLDTGEGAGIQKGMVLETDDFSKNTATEPLLVRSVSVDAVVVRRAFRDANLLFAHDATTYLRIDPRFSDNRIYDTLLEVAQNELWPQVWNPGETTLVYQAANEYYSPSVSNIEEVICVYQLSGGRKWFLQFEWFPEELSDSSNFPNGMLVIPGTVDSSTIYVAYKAMPVAFGSPNTVQVDNLLTLGAASLLATGEEIVGVAPDRGTVSQGVQGGDRARAGAVNWRQFTSRRQQEANRLLGILSKLMEPSIRRV
jgi:hypothetical protein